MARPSLTGRSILIVEDEPLIVLDLTTALEHNGAAVTSTNTLRHAQLLVEHDGLSGAILDHALPDGDSSQLRRRLKERGIPFMVYSGYREADVPGQDAPHFMKPQHPDVLVNAMRDLIREQARPCQPR